MYFIDKTLTFMLAKSKEQISFFYQNLQFYYGYEIPLPNPVHRNAFGYDR